MSIVNVSDILRESARSFPEKTALVSGTSRLTYRQLGMAVERQTSRFLEMGLKRGDRVAVAAGNGPELVVALFGIWRMGGVVLHFSPTVTPKDAAALMRRTGARVLVADSSQRGLHALAGDEPEVVSRVLVVDGESWVQPVSALGSDVGMEGSGSADDVACISYTTGSTGTARGVLLSHRNLVRNAELNLSYLDIGADDRFYMLLPLYFGMNRTSLLAHFLAGATVVLGHGILHPNGVLAAMRQEEITSVSAVPSIFHTLLTRADVREKGVPSLRTIRVGAGSVSSEMFRDLETAFPGARIYVTYGLTEVGLVSVLQPGDISSKCGSTGRVISEVELRIDPSGEILVRAPHAALGYEGDDDEGLRVFADDGVRTGDLGWIDPEGFLYLAGRSKELIKSGGENIVPREVEDLLSRHPGVSECAVIGAPDLLLGESVLAYVVPRPGEVLDEHELVRYCRQSLSLLQCPKRIVVCETLPRTANGKVDRRALREAALEE